MRRRGVAWRKRGVGGTGRDVVGLEWNAGRWGACGWGRGGELAGESGLNRRVGGGGERGRSLGGKGCEGV